MDIVAYPPFINTRNCLLATKKSENATLLENIDCKITDYIWLICHMHFIKLLIAQNNINLEELKTNLKLNSKQLLDAFPQV